MDEVDEDYTQRGERDLQETQHHYDYGEDMKDRSSSDSTYQRGENDE